ncbi:MAG: NAD-dependent epimerase/dehydratase family protein [Acidimicrobiia bacterium]
MTVVITGASGVVGGAVLRHLVAGGDRVRALVRSEEAAERVRSAGGDPVAGDITDIRSLIRAFHGADRVFHLAGLNAMCLSDPGALIRANVDGSRNVVRAVRVAGVGRLVHTSSAAALGEPAGTVGSEASPHRGSYLSGYERSKHLSESVVLTEGHDLEVVVVNPSSVQGPGRATGTGKLILDLVRGRLPVLVDSSISIVDIDDCARGHLLAADHGRPGERYVLNSFSRGTRDAVRLLEEVLGRALPVRYLPGGLASAGATLIEVAARAVGRRPPVCREMVRTLRHGHLYDGSKATRELGLTYTSPQDTLRRMIEWFESRGLLERR